MTRFAGVVAIARFNWPWYLLAAVVIACGIIVLQSNVVGSEIRWIGTVGLIVVALWLILSLGVSHYVYDRSAVSRGEWINSIAAGSVRTAGIFHAGHDEASATVKRALPSADVRTFDFYDSKRNGT